MTPAVGYTEMKDSGFPDIGCVPSAWTIMKVKHIFDVICGATPKENPENWDGNIPWIGPSDMPMTGTIEHGKRFISELGYVSCGTTLVPQNSIIISTRAPIGKICIATNRLCTNQGCKALVSRNKSINNRFFAYYLRSIIERLEVDGTGTTFKELSTSKLLNEPLIAPPISEQTAIATYLDTQCAKIDEIIAEAKASIEDYKQWKASIIYEAVTKGLDPNVEMKDSGFPDIGSVPSAWTIMKVKHIFDVICGATPKENPENWDGNIPWIGPSDMPMTGTIEHGKRFISELGYVSCGTTLVPQNSIIISTRAPIGKICIATNRLCTNQGCKALVSRNKSINNRFFAYYLRSIIERLEVDGTGTTFKELSTSKLLNEPLIVPPISEQSTIAAYLDTQCAKIDELSAEKQSLIADLETYKKSLIYEVVTGKRRVC